ncbi:MAG TPA: cation transporter [Syntrophorhabdus aromaticivorans]|nr:cation transporter [Syntrophorhabdus aromaticivorans]
MWHSIGRERVRLSPHKRLTITFFVTVFIMAAEVIGGLLSNSLALLSDAGHVVADAFAIAISIIAAHISRRPPDKRATYGYHRVGLLAGLVNGVSLLVIAASIFFESYERFTRPPTIDAPLMIAIALFGLLGNGVMASILGTRHEDLNMKSVWLHILGDTLSSVGVVVSGIIVYYTGWAYADPIASTIIGIVIVWGGARLTRETIAIFLDLTPRGFNVEGLAEKIGGVPGVIDVHDVHLRSVAHKRFAFSAHVWVHDQALSKAAEIRQQIRDMLREEGIHHVTLQFESGECENNGFYCRIHHEGEDNHHTH